MRRRARGALVTTALALVLGTGGDASAHYANGRWSSNHVLQCHFGCGPDSGTSVGEGDIVALWQQIVWSDGFLGLCGSTGVDGRFGTRTHKGTHDWQQYYSEHATETVVEALHGATQFYVDGIVGPQTWSLAESFLIPTRIDDTQFQTVYLYPGRYDGRSFEVYNEVLFVVLDEQSLAFVYSFEPMTRTSWPIFTGHPRIDYPTC